MFIFFLIYSILFLLLIIGIHFRVSKVDTLNIFLSVALLFTFFASIRWGIGADYFDYREWFYFPPDYVEVGYSIISEIVYKLFDANYQMLIIVTSVLTNFIFFESCWKYSNKQTALLVIYFYITIGSYFFYLNGIRQGIAIAILFFGFRFIKDKKLLMYILTCFVAYLFHAAALFAIITYFVCEKITKKKMIVLYLLSLCFIFVDIEGILAKINILPPAYQLYIDAGVVESFHENTSSISFLKLFIPNLFFIYLLSRDYYQKAKSEFTFYFLYIFFYNTVSMIPIINRIMYFFEPSLLTLLPYIYQYEPNYKLIFWCLGIYYFIFSIVTIIILKTHQCYPFTTIFG
ncbi:hypothetical protein Ga0466249_000120 [Sporomusaceae bacterium BoRhaA]|uniref:EpsG family protein n=1 Tax=Pelorhabdus rhamnosifermentans TaxID=2772457 RepID=UPI001C063288|nr:EpsG family protein [Pelorhabdus rhamnosifermentans]MBU2699041.1 hypothetical protein [Pelorhabdus rhamnosifermentans]